MYFQTIFNLRFVHPAWVLCRSKRSWSASTNSLCTLAT